MSVETTYKCDVDNAVVTEFEYFQAGRRTLIICKDHIKNDPAAVKALIAGENESLVDERKAEEETRTRE